MSVEPLNGDDKRNIGVRAQERGGLKTQISQSKRREVRRDEVIQETQTNEGVEIRRNSRRSPAQHPLERGPCRSRKPIERTERRKQKRYGDSRSICPGN